MKGGNVRRCCARVNDAASREKGERQCVEGGLATTKGGFSFSGPSQCPFIWLPSEDDDRWINNQRPPR
jgi:hypothetical protein